MFNNRNCLNISIVNFSELVCINTNFNIAPQKLYKGGKSYDLGGQSFSNTRSPKLLLLTVDKNDFQVPSWRITVDITYTQRRFMNWILIYIFHRIFLRSLFTNKANCFCVHSTFFSHNLHILNSL